MVNRRGFLASSVAVVGTTTLSGCVDQLTGGGEYPSEDINVIVPYSTGGGTDFYTRQVVPPIGEQLGTDMVIDNIPGSATIRGLSELYNAENDGHTIGAINIPDSHLGLLTYEADFEYRDFKAIGGYVVDAAVMVTNPEDEVENLQDLIERYQDGEFSSIGGTEGVPIILAYVMRSQYGMEWENFVEYGGSGETNQGVATGEIDAGYSSAGSALGPSEEGNIDVISVVYSNGAPLFPDVPTNTDEGFEEIDFAGGTTRGLYAPPGTDDSRIETVATAIEDAVNGDELQSWAEENSINLTYIGTDSLQEQYLSAFDKLEETVDLEAIRNRS